MDNLAVLFNERSNPCLRERAGRTHEYDHRREDLFHNN